MDNIEGGSDKVDERTTRHSLRDRKHREFKLALKLRGMADAARNPVGHKLGYDNVAPAVRVGVCPEYPGYPVMLMELCDPRNLQVT
jgi:hypothetical protein